jgi:hypothetical protein
VMTIWVAVTVRVSGFDAVLLDESRTWTVKLLVPGSTGAPEIVPPAPSVRPSGSEPDVIDQL